MKIQLTKTNFGLIPLCPQGKEYFNKTKVGQILNCELKKPRNPKFHGKFFALLGVGYEYWEPGEINNKYGTPQKNFDQFRGDVTILAGFYEVHTRLDGSTRIVPKSISFASMDDEEFGRLYQAVLTVLIEKIFIGYTDQQVIEMAEQQLLSFA